MPGRVWRYRGRPSLPPCRSIGEESVGRAIAKSGMTRIADPDTGASLFFDHRDPAMVAWLGGRLVD